MTQTITVMEAIQEAPRYHRATVRSFLFSLLNAVVFTYKLNDSRDIMFIKKKRGNEKFRR